MTTMATTATTTAMIVEVTGRQEEDNNADSPIVQERYGYHPLRAIYTVHLISYVINVYQICNYFTID